MAATLKDDGAKIPYSQKAQRRAAEYLGRLAEDEVATVLQRQGYEVLARRLKTARGEIDLVVADEQWLVFVEVKARVSFAEASYAVSPRQQVRLLSAAEVALAQHPEWARPQTRFDVALVVQDDIRIIENALWFS